MTFGAILQSFMSDQRTLTIFALILVDLITGVIAALKLRTFDAQRLMAFYHTNVLPGVLGYLLVWFLATFGLDQYLSPQLTEMINYLGAGTVIISLSASVIDNIRRSTAPTSRPETADMHVEKPSDRVVG